MTLGQLRVGVSFNPSKMPEVDEIKRRAAELIDAIDALTIPFEDMDPAVVAEFGRDKALAMTAIEDGCMWAVKAATRGK